MNFSISGTSPFAIHRSLCRFPYTPAVFVILAFVVVGAAAQCTGLITNEVSDGSPSCDDAVDAAGNLLTSGGPACANNNIYGSQYTSIQTRGTATIGICGDVANRILSE